MKVIGMLTFEVRMSVSAFAPWERLKIIDVERNFLMVKSLLDLPSGGTKVLSS